MSNGKPKLHELLAVESDREGKARRIIAETTKDFKDKSELFYGSVRTYQPFDEQDVTEYPEEHQVMATTVQDRLKYTAKSIIDHYDALLQKEATNQTAVADLIINGNTIAVDLPATFLLGMEKRLVLLRQMYEALPTLPVSIEWKPDQDKGDNTYSMKHPEVRMRTEKKIVHKILDEAKFPKEGQAGQSIPAQIEKWSETKEVGKFTKHIWSGAITSARKSMLLERIDNLIQAFKKARQRANNTEVVKTTVAVALMEYINK